MNQLIKKLTERTPPLLQSQMKQQEIAPKDEDVSNDSDLEFTTCEEKQNERPKIVMKKKIQKEIPKEKKNEKTLKKKLKPIGIREQWSDKHKILWIQPPEINKDLKSKRKYKLRILFQDAHGLKKRCTIRFGDRKGNDFIDHHNLDKRAIALMRIQKNFDSVLHPNYWRIWLLNTENSINEAWNKYIEMPEHNYLKINQQIQKCNHIYLQCL